MPEALPNLTFDTPSADALGADAPFWRIYDASFPSNEREPRSVILESLRDGVGLTIRAQAGGGVTVGFAIAHLLRQPPVLFLVYLAVVRELRSRRIGGALVEKIWAVATQCYAKHGSSVAAMIWEVDIPAQAASEEDAQQSRRRIAFFNRLGGQVLSGRYLQPPVDGVSAVPMYLMLRPAAGEPLPDESARSALVRALYFEKYHGANKISRSVLEDLLIKTAAEG